MGWEVTLLTQQVASALIVVNRLEEVFNKQNYWRFSHF